ncbi:hypothetical protein OAB57_03790 [Bacteriovoracaceae bacterium]|nr:hypothetical protein [Bacteriovoracaceae bacterium]
MKQLLSLFVLSFLLTTNTMADVFNVNMTVGGSTQAFGFSDIESVIDAIKVDKIDDRFTSYTGAELLNVSVDFRGLPLTLSAVANSNSIRLQIPSIGVDETFAGTSRDDSNESFKNWLKNEGGSALNNLMKKLVEQTPHDPLAGNPNSLMSKMVGNDFDRGRDGNSTRASTSGVNTNLLSIGVKASQFDQNGIDGKSLSLPIGYTVKFDDDPRKQLIIDMPISYYSLEDAKTYSLGLGAGFRFPINDMWSLTPFLGTGIVGSVDMGSVGQLISTGITSDFTRKLNDKYRIGVGNMLGYYTTKKIKVSDIESDADITNTVFRNAVNFSFIHPFFFGKEVESEVFLFDTRYFGDVLYMEQYNEFGLSIGTNRDKQDVSRLMRFGLSYLFSSKTKGFSFNFGYAF